MKVDQWLKLAEDTLQAVDIDSARLDAQLIAQMTLDIPREQLLISTAEITPAKLEELNVVLKKRSQRQPLAYLTNRREFYNQIFFVNEHVLIPRPETEVMVDFLIQEVPQKAAMLEIGTGSGAISVAAKLRRKDIQIAATDISDEALKVAHKNAATHNAVIDFMQSDMFSLVEGQFDVVAANLPYVPISARRQPEINFEPDVALFGGVDGLDHYRNFLRHVDNFLKPNGWFIIEASPTQYGQLGTLAQDAGFQLSAISEYVFVGAK